MLDITVRAPKTLIGTRESTVMWNAIFLGVTFWWLHMTRDAGNAFALPPRDTYGKYEAHKEIILKPVC